MGYSHPEASASLVPRGVVPRRTSLVPKGVGAELQPARRPQGGWEAGTRFVSIVLAMLLAVTMLPASGLSSAYADEPVERPATSGGDVALSGANGAAAVASQAPVAEMREDGMHVADGLAYTVADGGLALIGFGGDIPEGALVVPAAVMLDGKETSVVAIDLAEGQVADKVVVLSLPQGVKSINTATLAPAFPALLSVEVAGASSTLPVAAGAASMRADYSTSGGMLFRPTTVTVQNDDGAIESIECKELLWAPPALVSARIPVECRAIAEGAFADARDLKTIVAFGTMERIADGAFSADQMESSKVVVPASSPAVTDAERVSASMALMGDAGQKERRGAWHEAGWRTDDIVMGKPYGSLTETVAVTAEGAIERTELQLVSYPGAHERAMDLKKPNAVGVVEQAESGLAFTVKSDMTASVTWQGDKTATPAHIDIPASVVIDNVTYPVTEIAPNAFEGAVFLTSVAIPEGVTTIGQDAFKDCPNLAEIAVPSTLRETSAMSSVRTSAQLLLEEETGQPTQLRMPTAGSGEGNAFDTNTGAPHYQTVAQDAGITPYLGENEKGVRISFPSDYMTIGDLVGVAPAATWTSCDGAGMDYVMYDFPASSVLRVFQHDQIRLGIFLDSQRGFVQFSAKAGYVVSGFTISGAKNIGNDGVHFFTVSPGELCEVTVSVLPDVSKLATASQLASLTATVNGKANSNLLSSGGEAAFTPTSTVRGAITDAKNLASQNKADIEAINSSFGTISYNGLDGSDASVYPTSYRKGGTPALPVPAREGYRFAGWSWSRGGASGDPSNIADAFAEAGAVTLTANWEEPATPEAKHFFTSESPLRHDEASATQAHVIKVRLSSSPGTLASVSFEGDDLTGLLKETSGVRLFVGASEDALSSGTELSWGGATSSGWECELARFSDDSYGVYVGVSVPTSAIDESAIPVSYADGSYVASLVKMNYAFA